jgi:hypothetical protein
MTRLLTALVFAVVTVAPVSADLTYVTKMTARPSTVPVPPPSNPMYTMLGGVIITRLVPPGGIQMTATIGERGARIEFDQAYLIMPAGTALVIRPDGSGVVIDPAAKTFWKVAKMTPGVLGGALAPEVQLTPTGDTETIAGTPAVKSTVAIRVALPAGPGGATMAGLPSDIRLSGEIWLAEAYARYAPLIPVMASGLAALGIDMREARGFPMRTVMRSELFAGQQVESVVTSLRELTAPADAFEVPAGFTEVPQPPVPGMGVGR